MSEERSNLTTRKIRNRALLGTAAAVVLGGVLAGEAVLLPKSTALADAVRVEGVQPVSFADVVEKVRPAVVSVRVKTPADDKEEMSGMNSDPGESFDFPKGSPMEKFFKQFRDGERGGKWERRGPAMSLGSGFIISEDGYVVTNDHVVDKGQTLTVIMDDGTEYTAKVIGVDEKTDLALLKINDAQPQVHLRQVRRRQDPRRRLGGRRRQSVRPRRHGHGRHRLGERPRRSAPVPMTTSSRSTRPSTAAIPAARPSTSTAR